MTPGFFFHFTSSTKQKSAEANVVFSSVCRECIPLDKRVERDGSRAPGSHWALRWTGSAQMRFTPTHVDFFPQSKINIASSKKMTNPMNINMIKSVIRGTVFFWSPPKRLPATRGRCLQKRCSTETSRYSLANLPWMQKVPVFNVVFYFAPFRKLAVFCFSLAWAETRRHSSLAFGCCWLAADIQSVWASTQAQTWNIKWHRPGKHRICRVQLTNGYFHKWSVLSCAQKRNDLFSLSLNQSSIFISGRLALTPHYSREEHAAL